MSLQPRHFREGSGSWNCHELIFGYAFVDSQVAAAFAARIQMRGITCCVGYKSVFCSEYGGRGIKSGDSTAFVAEKPAEKRGRKPQLKPT